MPTPPSAPEQPRFEAVDAVYHELKSPLAVIEGALDLVLSGDAGPVSEAQREFLAVALAESERMHRMLEDLLDIERSEVGLLRLRADVVPLRPIAERLAVTARAQAALTGLEFRAEIEGDPCVKGDGARLEQAIRNLLSNALKYTAQGHVALAVRADGDRATVAVADTGIGLAPEELAWIFQKFRRGEHPYVKTVRGSGLGLAIARAVVAAMGGELGVESKPGHGSTFAISLPLSR